MTQKHKTRQQQSMVCPISPTKARPSSDCVFPGEKCCDTDGACGQRNPMLVMHGSPLNTDPHTAGLLQYIQKVVFANVAPISSE